MKTKKFLWSMLVMMMVGVMSVSLVSCGGDDDSEPNPDSGQDIKPDAKVDDPTGTISLSMRNANNGTTYLDYIYINKGDNFYGDGYVYFTSVGAVNGLGNVSTIPTTGWTNQVAVKPGNGYVAYDKTRNTFYRIYVEDYIEAAVTGGVIGADVKYQKPFKGKDEAIKLDETALAFDADGGTQTLTFTNTTIIPFTYESTDDWCHVYTSSTNTAGVPDGIAIQVDPHNAAKATEATVKLTTLYGRETTIKVVRAEQGPYAVIEGSEFWYGAEAQTQYLSVASNVDIAKLSVESDQSWCTATIEDLSEAMYAKAQKVLFVDDQPSSRAGFENNDARSYRLTVNITKNYDEEERVAVLTVKSKDGKVSASTNIRQYGSYNYLSFNVSEQEVLVDGGQSYIGYTTSLPTEELKVQSNAAWCKAEIDEATSSVIVTCEENNSSAERRATVTLSSKSGNRSATVTIIQRTPYLTVSTSEWNCDKNRNNITITLNTNKSEWEATSSDESWCTFSQNGNQITIRTTEATEDRTATITFENFDTTIKVHQSKYAVGDSYNENGLEGTVSYIGEKGRWIRKYMGKAKWSTELVLTGANSETDGEYNMNVIKKIPGWEELYPAFKLVDDLNTNGVTGWIFPAGRTNYEEPFGQFDLVNIDKYNSGASCWFSNEANARDAYATYYAWGSRLKDDVYHVYAIHSF